MELVELLHAEPEFEKLTPRKKICLFSWFLHTHGGVDVLTTGAIRDCYRKLNIVEPNVALYMPRMVSSAPIQLLQVRGGYKLEGNLRRQMDEKYGQHPSVVRVQKLLADLPAKIPDINERVFLQETLNCYRVQAYRAAIVMAWNLAFDHILRWIIGDAVRLAKFNAAIVTRYPKRAGTTVSQYDDFSEEFKESEIIEICRTADLISKNQKQILDEKLKRRNIAAHPSSVTVTQPQADDAISDLVNNVVLLLT
jgi:hypothetical protein